MTLQEAKNLIPRKSHLFSITAPDAKGFPQCWKVSSVKRWKRNPDRVEIKIHRGLYEWATLKEEHFPFWSLSNEEACYRLIEQQLLTESHAKRVCKYLVNQLIKERLDKRKEVRETIERHGVLIEQELLFGTYAILKEEQK